MPAPFDPTDSDMNAFLQVAELANGAVIDEKYRIRRLVGEGAFGRVYEAEDLHVRRRVALKTVFTDPSTEQAKRFEREIELIKGIEHGNVVRLYDFGTSDQGFLYMVMEFVEGRDLGDVLRDDGPFELHRALNVTFQILDALVEAQKLGVVHRDLKPQNIILTEKGARRDVAKLLDFGLAKNYGESGFSQLGFVSSTFTVGTPLYMAPEQIENLPTGPYTDVYAVGLILIEMLTGVPPFVSDNVIELLSEKTSKPVDIPRAALHPRLVPILERALAQSYQARFATAWEMYAALQNFVATPEDLAISPTIAVMASGRAAAACDPADSFFKELTSTHGGPEQRTRQVDPVRRTMELGDEPRSEPSQSVFETSRAPASGAVERPPTDPGVVPLAGVFKRPRKRPAEKSVRQSAVLSAPSSHGELDEDE